MCRTVVKDTSILINTSSFVMMGKMVQDRTLRNLDVSFVSTTRKCDC